MRFRILHAPAKSAGIIYSIGVLVTMSVWAPVLQEELQQHTLLLLHLHLLLWLYLHHYPLVKMFVRVLCKLNFPISGCARWRHKATALAHKSAWYSRLANECRYLDVLICGCVCVFVCACIVVCVRVSAWVWVSVRVSACVWVRVCVRVCLRMYERMRVLIIFVHKSKWLFDVFGRFKLRGSECSSAS